MPVDPLVQRLGEALVTNRAAFVQPATLAIEPEPARAPKRLEARLQLGVRPLQALPLRGRPLRPTGMRMGTPPGFGARGPSFLFRFSHCW